MKQMLDVSKAIGKIGVDLPSITAKISSVWKSDNYTNILRQTVSGASKARTQCGISV